MYACALLCLYSVEEKPEITAALASGRRGLGAEDPTPLITGPGILNPKLLLGTLRKSQVVQLKRIADSLEKIQAAASATWSCIWCVAVQVLVFNCRMKE